MNIGKLKPAAVFSDNMVLQRDKRVSVFGTGTNGRTVTVNINGRTASAKIENGRWRVIIAPMSAGGPYTLTISDAGNAVEFENILVGEVFLAGGQSNMELELQNCANGKEEIRGSANGNIRFYNVPKAAVEGGELYKAEDEASWQVLRPETSASMSAVAYFCAQKLQACLSVPVGIIDCYWGGTSISCWMSEWQLSRSRAGQRYLDDYSALMGSKTDEQYDEEMREYNRKFKAWDAAVKAMRAKDPLVSWEVLNVECGPCPWPQPAGKKSPYRPAGLYKTMISRVCPYTIRGFLYYQGEEDQARCEDYGEMMCYLIANWREDWEDDEIPFVFVQLPRFISKADYDRGVDNRRWCVIRENQWRVSRTIKNTAVAVTIDCGEFDNVHPLDKQTVGRRLALQVLKTVFGEPVQADGPVFAGAYVENGTIRAEFANAFELHFKDGKGAGFEIAGQDCVYCPANAKIEGRTVVLTSDEVPDPHYVRYAWFSWGEVSLFSESGLPAAPFRSGRC